MRVAVIGAGPSGLVTLKYLLASKETSWGKDKIEEVRLFESQDDVGGAFLWRMYEDAELVSSRQLTCFSDFRCEGEPDFLSAPRYQQYLRDYCTRFDLWPHIHLSSTVQNVEYREDGTHALTYTLSDKTKTEETWECDAVAVCSGLHVYPNLPRLDGQERIPAVLHSSEVKSRSQFGVDTTVLVVGSGESGADMAHLAVTSPTKRVVLSHRNGFHLAPKRNPRPRFKFGQQPQESLSHNARPQIPIDVSRASIFDTSYVHPWLRDSDILWKYYTLYLKAISWVSWGTTEGYDQWIGGKPEGWSASEIFFNKAGHKVSPYISSVWKPRYPTTILGRLRSLIIQDQPSLDTRGRTIEVAPWPTGIDLDGTVRFRDNGRPEYAAMSSLTEEDKVRPDVVVFCTGYKQEFPFLQGYYNQGTKKRDSPENHVMLDSIPHHHQHHGDHTRRGSNCSKDSGISGLVAEEEQQKEVHPGEEKPRKTIMLIETSTTTTTTSNPPSLPPPPSASTANVRGIWNSTHGPKLGFIGFVRPNLGAIPPLAEMQAQLWVLHLLMDEKRGGQQKNLRLKQLDPEDEAHYRLHAPEGARIGYGVDHESYAYQLALDSGCAGSFGEVVRLGVWESLFSRGGGRNKSKKNGRGGRESAWWKLPLAWALGAHITTKFRLCGPWAWEEREEEEEEKEGAVDVMMGEVWDTVARREWFFGHFTLSILPMMIFGPLSLLSFLVALFLEGILGFQMMMMMMKGEKTSTNTSDWGRRVGGKGKRMGVYADFS